MREGDFTMAGTAEYEELNKKLDIGGGA